MCTHHSVGSLCLTCCDLDNSKCLGFRVKTKTASKYGLSSQPRLVDIIAAVPPHYRKALIPKLRAKPIRTASGVSGWLNWRTGGGGGKAGVGSSDSWSEGVCSRRLGLLDSDICGQLNPTILHTMCSQIWYTCVTNKYMYTHKSLKNKNENPGV